MANDWAIRYQFADQIFAKLDKKDGSQDGIIKASVWNSFIDENGIQGNKISVSIDKDRACRSIATYFTRMKAQDESETNESLAEKWMDTDKLVSFVDEDGNLVEEAIEDEIVNEEESTEGAEISEDEELIEDDAAVEFDDDDYDVIEAGELDDVDEVDSVEDETPDNTPPASQNPVAPTPEGGQVDPGDYAQIATNIEDALSRCSFGCAETRRQARNEAKRVMKQIKPENVAYILEKFPNLATKIDDIDAMGAGFDKTEVIEYVLKPLKERAEQLGISVPENIEKKSVAEMKKEMNKIAEKIRIQDQRATNKEYVNNNHTAVQKAMKDAKNLLVETSNKNQRPPVQDLMGSVNTPTGAIYPWRRSVPMLPLSIKQVTLDNGTLIKAYFNNNEITQVSVVNPNNTTISYTENGAGFGRSSDEAVNYTKTSDYNFDEIKELCKKIFA